MTKIHIGFATLLGTVGAAAGLLIPMIGQLADAAEPLGVSPQVWVIVSAVMATAVVLGRMAQAVAGVSSGLPPVDDSDPGALVHPEPTVPSDARPPNP